MAKPKRGRRWGVLFAVGFGAGVFVGGIEQALLGLLSGIRWNWAEMGLYVLLWTALLPPFWSAGRLVGWSAGRGSASPGPVVRTRAQLKEHVASALRAGALPPHANPDFWRSALRDEVRRWSGLRWASVGFALVGGGLIGAAAVVANDNAWGVWVVAVVVIAESLAAFRLAAQRLHVARRLLMRTASP